jgi:hypothetical protein
LWEFLCHLHSEFQCESSSLLHDQAVYSKCLLHHSHYSFVMNLKFIID